MVPEAVFTYANDVTSPGRARAAAVAWAEGSPKALLLALELIISELVTNAIRHSVGDVTMTLAMGVGGVEVRVQDGSSELPVPRAVEAGTPGGRGLHLVERLSSSWGTSVPTDGFGKVVWAVISGEEPAVGAMVLPDQSTGAPAQVRTAPRGRSVQL